MKNIPFHKPIMPKDLNILFSKSLKNGWLTTGPEVKSFESDLKNYIQSDNIVCVNSCTAALHLALAAKGFGSGDKFIVPTYTFVASVEVGEYLGMEPVFVDCDKHFNMDLNQVYDILKRDQNIKAIIPVHFAGRPVNMKKLFSLAHENNIFILEDAAHALETISNVAKVGNTNHATAFSFYANKNITSAGEGGAISTNDKILAGKVRQLSLHGMTKDGWNRFKTGKKWQYDVSTLGYKYNMTDFAASFGKWQMKQLRKWYDKRVQLVNIYQENFNKIEGLICPASISGNEKHAYHLYIIRIIPSRWSIDRNQMIEFLNNGGIGTSVHYKPVHMHSYYQKKYGFKEADYPNSSALYENVITLPLYPALKKQQIYYIIEFVVELWKKYKL